MPTEPRQQIPQKRRRLNVKKHSGVKSDTGSYMLKHYMALDRAKICPIISRKHLKDILALPIKKDKKEKGLFDHLLSTAVKKEEEEKKDEHPTEGITITIKN